MYFIFDMYKKVALVIAFSSFFMKNLPAQERYPFDVVYTQTKPFTIVQVNDIADNIIIFSNERILDYGKSWITVSALWVKTFTIDFYLFSIWAHEEGHRSILNSHGIYSKNDWVNWAVDGVENSELQKLKKNHYSDFIRLHTAGLESQGMRVLSLEEKLNFESNRRDAVMFPLFYNKFYQLLYLNSGLTNNYFDVAQNELRLNSKDKDIVGHDVYGMIHHLFHSNEIDYEKRYYHRDDLSDSEKEYLKKIENTSWIIFLDSNLFLPHINVGKVQFSTGMNYYPAPFGDVIESNTFLISSLGKNRVSFRFYRNHSWVFPSIEIEDYRRPFGSFCLTTSLSFWQNPSGFDFYTKKFFYGIGAKVEIEYLWDHFGIYLGTIAKTRGFYPGYNQKNLRQEVSVYTGISFLWNPPQESGNLKNGENSSEKSPDLADEKI